MNDKEFNTLIQEAFRNERELPEGLSDRLERHIDQLAAEEKEARKPSPAKKRLLYWFSGIAASFLLAMAIFFQVEKPVYPTMADTFNDPQEAAMAAQNALSFLSSQFNKGLDQISEAGKEVDKVNEIVNKQFETLNIQQ